MIIEIDKNYEKLGSFLEHKGFSDAQIDLYFLQHYGVAGMKWGQRKAARQRNRELNRASRAKDKAKYQSDIDKARSRFESGKVQGEWTRAKAQHKINKQELGSREARKILNKTKEKHWKDLETAQQVRDGKEAALLGLAVVGAMGLGVALSAAQNRGF